MRGGQQASVGFRRAGMRGGKRGRRCSGNNALPSGNTEAAALRRKPRGYTGASHDASRVARASVPAHPGLALVVCGRHRDTGCPRLLRTCMSRDAWLLHSGSPWYLGRGLQRQKAA